MPSSVIRSAALPLLSAAALVFASTSRLSAQTIGGAPRSSSSATAILGFLSTVTPATPTLIPRTRARCSPGDCWSQFVGVRANANWRLQVRLATAPVGYTVSMSLPATPATVVTVLSTATWVDTPLTGSATATRNGEVTFYTARRTGPTGRVPTATEVAGVLQYQMIRLP